MGRAHRWRRRLDAAGRCHGGGERGAVVVEYATVLALVVVAAALGLTGVHDAATVVLERQAGCVAAAAPLDCPPPEGPE